MYDGRDDFEAIWLTDIWPRLMAHPRARASYPTADAVAAGGLMYGQALSDLALDVLAAAVEQCLATCDWLPSPANIREAAGVLVDDQHPTPLEAWAEVLKRIENPPYSAYSLERGTYTVPGYEIQNPVARKAAESIGWRQLENSENLVSDRAQFVAEYERQVRREAERARIVPQARALLAESRRPELPAAAPEPARPSAGGRSLLCSRCARGFFVPASVDVADPFVCGFCREVAAPVAATQYADEVPF